MSVTQKVVAGLAILLLVAALAIGLTAWLSSPLFAAVVWIGSITILLLASVLVPVRTDDLVVKSDPCESFAQSLERFEAGLAASEGRLNPLCHPRLLHHGSRTDIGIVLIHGISSCPQAFVDFAPKLHDRGHNVLVARMPCNGLKDRSTDALNRLTAEELTDFGNRVVDLATGLGNKVVVCGISAGGTVAAWIGQTRPEADRAVLIAPFVGLPGIGLTLNILLMRIMLLLPPMSVWKDPVLRERYEGMAHAYKRQSTRGTGEVLRLAYATAQKAKTQAPAADHTVLVTNANDKAIDNRIAAHFADLWHAAGNEVMRYQFPETCGLGHEIIDPLEPGADPSLTYPVLFELIEGKTPPAIASATA